MSLSLSSAAVLFTSLTLNALFTICCSRQTALFLSLLAKTALAYLPIALSVALRPPFSFQQVQYVQVFPLKPAPFCTLFVGLGSTNKSATFLLLSDSRSVLATLTSSLRFLLPQCLWKIWQELSSLSSFSIRLQWVPGTRFSRGTTWLMSWPDWERHSYPLQSLVVSLLYLSYPLFSFLGLEAYCLIKILRRTGSLGFHQKTCAPTSCSLCSVSSSLQRTRPTVKLLSL